MMKHGTPLLAGILAGALCLAGCSAGASESDTDTTATQISVTVSAYPLQFLTERIIGSTGTVTNLTAPGAEPHDLELTARQIAGMATTDAVVYIAGFQSAVDDAIATASPKLAIDASAGLTFLAATAGEEGEQTKAGAHDPHVWLSPANMVIMAKTISADLSAAKPALASTFAANTATLLSELKTLDASYKAGLAHCERTQFITSHAAFAYLAERYGLQQIPISGIDPTTEPTAARIAEIQTLATKYKVTTIFFETLVSDTVATSIADDLGLSSAVLDPIEGITAKSAGTNYLEVMASNLTSLKKANGCS